MSNAWNGLKDAVLGSILETLREFAKEEDVAKFAAEKAEAFAREKWAAITAGTDEERKQHEDNLRHLTAQIRGEAARLQLRLSSNVKDWIGRVVEVAGGLLGKIGKDLLGV